MNEPSERGKISTNTHTHTYGKKNNIHLYFRCRFNALSLWFLFQIPGSTISTMLLQNKCMCAVSFCTRLLFFCIYDASIKVKFIFCFDLFVKMGSQANSIFACNQMKWDKMMGFSISCRFFVELQLLFSFWKYLNKLLPHLLCVVAVQSFKKGVYFDNALTAAVHIPTNKIVIVKVQCLRGWKEENKTKRVLPTHGEDILMSQSQI